MPGSRTAAFATLVAALLVGGCSSSHHADPTAGSSSVRIVSFTGPRSPVQCNAPTSVELHWETQDAKSVTLSIDNSTVAFATYPNGASRELVPLACDGKPQTYRLTAHASGGASVTRSLTVRERAST